MFLRENLVLNKTFKSRGCYLKKITIIIITVWRGKKFLMQDLCQFQLKFAVSGTCYVSSAITQCVYFITLSAKNVFSIHIILKLAIACVTFRIR